MRNVLYCNETRIQINTKFKPKVTWIFVPRRHPTLTPSEFSSGVILTRFGSISTRSSSSLIFLISSAPHTCESSEAWNGHLRNHAGMKNASLFACSFRLFPSFFFSFIRSFIPFIFCFTVWFLFYSFLFLFWGWISFFYPNTKFPFFEFLSILLRWHTWILFCFVFVQIKWT